MCDLVTAAAVGSLAFGAMGAYQQSQATKASMNYQSQVAHNNAVTAEYQAEDAIRRGQLAEQDQRRRTALLKGTQTARLAANGIDISDGSALQILSDTDWMGEQDALTVRDNANREAWGYRVQAQNASSNSDMLKSSADAQSPLLSGTMSVMTNPSLGAVASKWYTMGNAKTSSFTTNNSAGNSSSVFA